MRVVILLILSLSLLLAMSVPVTAVHATTIPAQSKEKKHRASVEQILSSAPPMRRSGTEFTTRSVAAHEIMVAPPLTTLRVGERLKYQGRWMGIPVGWGSVEVREIVERQGRTAYHLVGEAHTNAFLSKLYAVNDVVHSYVDVQELHTLRFEKSQHEGHYQAEEAVTFDHEKGIATYESFVNRQMKEFLHEAVKQVPIPSHAQDPLSAFFILRLKPVLVGRPMYVDIYSDEKYFHTEIKVLQTLSLELRRRGVFDAIQVEPIAKFKGLLVNRGKVHLYLTADRRRIPLYIQLWTPWGLVTGTIDRDSIASGVSADQ